MTASIKDLFASVLAEAVNADLHARADEEAKGLTAEERAIRAERRILSLRQAVLTQNDAIRVVREEADASSDIVSGALLGFVNAFSGANLSYEEIDKVVTGYLNSPENERLSKENTDPQQTGFRLAGKMVDYLRSRNVHV